MYYKKLILTLVIVFSLSTLFAQSLALNLGYDFIGKSAGYSGLDFRLNPPSTMNNAKNIGVGVYFTTSKSRFFMIPVVHYLSPINKDFEGNLAVSTKNITPSIGINFFNLCNLNFGYNFSYKNNGFGGAYVGLHIMLGNNSFYDNINWQ